MKRGIVVKPDKRPFADLLGETRRSGSSAVARASAGIELAYYRGYQGGYEQAMADHKKGQMKAANAFKPSRLK